MYFMVHEAERIEATWIRLYSNWDNDKHICSVSTRSRVWARVRVQSLEYKAVSTSTSTENYSSTTSLVYAHVFHEMTSERQ